MFHNLNCLEAFQIKLVLQQNLITTKANFNLNDDSLERYILFNVSRGKTVP